MTQRYASEKIRVRLDNSAMMLSIALVAVWMTGQFVRDINWWMALMFYFPTPVLVAWLLLLLSISGNRRRLYCGLLLPPMIMLLTVEHRWFCSQSSSNVNSSQGDVQSSTAVRKAIVDHPMRLIHWNLARSVMGWEQQWQHITGLNPDIIVLSEIPEPFDPSTLKGFDVLIVDCMAIACHGRMVSSGTLIRERVLNAFHVTCKLPEGPLELMVADMTSNVMLPRGPYLRPFVELLAERKIDVSVGDFNAPRRSLAFCNLPAGFQHAYDAVGAGWSCTWPVPVPFLAIDQCITGIRVQPLRYELQSTRLSDHRLQILDFSVMRGSTNDHSDSYD